MQPEPILHEVFVVWLVVIGQIVAYRSLPTSRCKNNMAFICSGHLSLRPRGNYCYTPGGEGPHRCTDSAQEGSVMLGEQQSSS